MTTYESTVDTPAGPFTMVVDGDGNVLASGWTADVGALLSLVPSKLVDAPPTHRRELGLATRAAQRYHGGDLDAPADVPVHQHTSGGFLGAAWKTLREIAPGQPISYAELAIRTGNPAAARAAAQACARNAAALFVPCHRVIRSDGTLGGFRWGLSVKRWLLDHESGQPGVA